MEAEARYVTSDANPERFRLFRLCDCPICEGTGKEAHERGHRCLICRGEGRVRQELATCATPEAVGVMIVRLGRERELEQCPIGLLDSDAKTDPELEDYERISWLIRPWLPSARNVSDAARTLAKSKRTS